jgi:hypothetical protein
MNKHSRWACDFCGGTGHVSIVDALAGWAVLLVIVGSILALGEWVWHLFAKK